MKIPIQNRKNSVEEGYVVNYCNDCDKDISDRANMMKDKDNQKSTLKEEAYLAPTCTKDGFVKISCSYCGWREAYRKTVALGHDIGTGTIAVDEKGKYYICQREGCGAKVYIV